MNIKYEAIDKVFKRMTKKRRIKEAVLLVEHMKGDVLYDQGYGDKDIDAPLVMASITKLFTTTCIYILQDEQKLTLDDPLTKFFKEDILHQLHIYKGQDYSQSLTIAHLLFQTSGLADIFAEGKYNLRKQVIDGDFSFEFPDLIGLTKTLKPHFSPEKATRAHYADVNFDLLGGIIECLTGLSLADAYKQLIFRPLKLENTYLPTSEADFIPNVYYKEVSLQRPKYIRSCRASGGCISTGRELILNNSYFIKI